MQRQSNSYEFSLTLSAKYSSTFTVEVSVPANNRIKWVRICAMSYEKIATTIESPYFLDMGFMSDFGGTIPDSSGSSITTTGTIFTGMKDWGINDANSVLDYSLTFSVRTYTVETNSLTKYSASYLWYRMETCPDYYFLSEDTCAACDISC